MSTLQTTQKCDFYEHLCKSMYLWFYIAKPLLQNIDVNLFSCFVPPEKACTGLQNTTERLSLDFKSQSLVTFTKCQC